MHHSVYAHNALLYQISRSEKIQRLTRRSFLGLLATGLFGACGGDVVAHSGAGWPVSLSNATHLQLLVVLQLAAGKIRGLAWSPDGRTLAVGADDNTLRFWHMQSRRQVPTLQGTGLIVFGVAWSAHCERLAVANSDGSARYGAGRSSGKTLRPAASSPSAVR
jgi:WD40 repeat protein